MPRIDLNIVDRGTKGTTWIAENTCITADNLSKVTEMKTDNVGALNSLPTPFARFYVVKEAFRRVTEEKRKPENETGEAYKMIVSDCLDVLELLFNYKFHKNSWGTSKSLSIKEWNRVEKMNELKGKVPILYNSLNTYFDGDLNENKLYFLVYKDNGREYLLACSSPMTLFVTPPDMDRNTIKQGSIPTMKFEGEYYKNLHISSKSGREYFRKPCLFGERDVDFKNYLYNNIFGGSVDDRFKEIHEYIKLFRNDKDIKQNNNVDIDIVETDSHDELVINGIKIGSNKAIDINSYFTTNIIKVPYRLSEADFELLEIRGDKERNFDFLMPFKPEILNLFDSVSDCKCHIRDENNVEVTIKYKGKEYSRVYRQNQLKETEGRIIDVGVANQNFDIGIFPNILSTESNENNYFKILLAISDNDEAPQLSVDKVNLSFYRKEDGNVIHINEETSDFDFDEYGVRTPIVRTRINNSQDRKDGYESKFYEIYKTKFDAIKIDIFDNSGLIIPNWKRSQQSQQSFKYAVDLGTSNTFIARCQIGQNNRPELFELQQPMISYLHTHLDNGRMSLANRIEDSIFEEGKKAFITEFAPPIIDQRRYKFPIRTALCHVKGNTEKASLFDNHNIAFFYEKEMETSKQEILTDIKWEGNENRLRVFIRELLLMIKADVLQRNGDLDCTEIVWFRPLSFRGNIKEIYERIWKEETKTILDVDSDKVTCVIESEAPYYYFKVGNQIPNTEAVTIIDIGGGSTDFVYFKGNKPEVANSVQFGCNVLWDNGTSGFENERENGIYKAFIETIQFGSHKLQQINDGMKTDRNIKTRDIINFWIDNETDCDIIQQIRKKFKPVFVFHLTAILYYMANMYRDKGLAKPCTVVFSGNGSKYIDNFISNDGKLLKKIIDLVFNEVYNVKNSDVHLKLPNERKESTCYGGLYWQKDEPFASPFVYQGNDDIEYENVGEIIKNYKSIKQTLKEKYEQMVSVYREVLSLMTREGIFDNGANIETCVATLDLKSILEALDTNFRKEVKDKYHDNEIYYGSMFFLPVIDKVFELTKK